MDKETMETAAALRAQARVSMLAARALVSESIKTREESERLRRLCRHERAVREGRKIPAR